jgi:hypothetical protein
MIALDAAVRRLTVCQLTHESRGNGGGLRPPAWLRLRTAGGKLDPGWNLTIGRRIQFLLVLGHMKRTPKLLCMGLFSKIAKDCDPRSALSRVSMFKPSFISSSGSMRRVRHFNENTGPLLTRMLKAQDEKAQWAAELLDKFQTNPGSDTQSSHGKVQVKGVGFSRA